MRATQLIPILALAGLTACDGGAPAPGTPAETPAADGPHALPVLDGKDDNYISTNAREFELHGTAHFDLPDNFEAGDDDRLRGLAQARLNHVARALRRHVDDTLRPFNGDATGEAKPYFTYFRQDAVAVDSVATTDDGRGRFDFVVEFVGANWTMSKLTPDGSRQFEVAVTEWGVPEPEVVPIRVRGSDSRDAFPKYDVLFADGVFDIAMHFGGDYNEERFDMDTARWTVETLFEGGWAHTTATTFEDLTLESGPFTRTMTVKGRTVEMRVYVYHSDMVPEDAPREAQQAQIDALSKSLAERDVVLYSGHAGPGAGFVLDYQPRLEVKPNAFDTLKFADKYQIYVLDGCQTYRTYADDLIKHSPKSFHNLDIVTTVNTTPFSVGYQVIHQLLHWITLTTEDGTHLPLTWKSILRGVNTDAFDDVHYGVHGIDHDPGLNPNGGADRACAPCSTDADCGGGGNFCLGYGETGACGVACAHDTACGEGFRCARLFDAEEYWYLPKQCVRRDYTCGG